jgi:hypothetical protein
MATVRCEVCGGMFSQSYLASHKRLAHRKNKTITGLHASEDDRIRTIVSLYGELSAGGRARVMRLLKGKNKKREEKLQE